MNAGWLSLLPPVVAIGLAIKTRQVFISLFFGIWLGWTILAGGNPIVGLKDSMEACVHVFSDPGNTKVIGFSAIVGALIALTQRSGGVLGFVNWIQEKQLISSRRRARLLAWLIGVVVFVESSITCLVNGSVCRPVFDQLHLSREKLAYFCDATSAPVCILIPLNAWGAYIIGLLNQQHYDSPVHVLISSMPFNFYALLTLGFSFFLAWSGWDFGPMAKAEKRSKETGEVLRKGAEPLVAREVVTMEPLDNVKPKARNFLVPIFVLIAMMPIGLYITGNGHITQGSGSTSVFWSVSAATLIAAVLYRFQGIFSSHETVDVFFKGFGGLMPLAILMVLAFAMGDLAREMKTGVYVASLVSGFFHPGFVPALLFVVSGFIAFSTGTSFGTFGIMIPVAVPLIHTLGVPDFVALAAVLGGGVFGDHCSPISDTTIISSMASASDHMDHVNTQLPYALLVASVSVCLYLIAGFLISV